MSYNIKKLSQHYRTLEAILADPNIPQESKNNIFELEDRIRTGIRNNTQETHELFVEVMALVGEKILPPGVPTSQE